MAFDRIYYSPDDGTGSTGGSVADTGSIAPDIGHAVSAPETSGNVDTGTFLEIADEKGIKKSWRTRDEFLKDWKNMGMLRSDYSRKTDEIARIRKEHESKVSEWERQRQETESKFKKYNDFLSKNPHVYKQLEDALKGGLPPEAALDSARSYADEKYSELQKRLEELDGWKRSREQEESKRKLYDSFKERYEDFDETATEDLLKVLSEGDSESILELLYHAHKGRSMPSPVEAEKKIVDRIQAKGAARVLPGNGPKASAPIQYKSLADAEAAALAGLH